MIWLYILGITMIVVLLILFEWSKLNLVKEKISFIVLTALGYVMVILLMLHPDLPGPTQLVEVIYKPLGKLLEK